MTNDSIITNEDIDTLIEVYRGKIKAAQDVVNDLQGRVDRFLNAKSGSPKLSNRPAPVLKPFDTYNTGYNSQWTWKRKIDYILKDGGKTTAQIASAVQSLEPDTALSRDKIVGSLSAVLSVWSKPGKLYEKQEVEGQDSIYKKRVQ